MNKKVLIGVGLVVLGLAVFVSHKKAQNSQEETVGRTVPQASRLPSNGQGSSQTVASAMNVNVVAVSSPRADGELQRGADAASAEELSDPVKALLGLDGKERNYSELLQAIGMLGYDLSAADVAALREMLTWSNDRFPEKMRDIEINAVKNDVLDKLLRQTELSEGLGLQMAEMASDPSNDSVWRDYSIQFMGQFYGRFKAENVSQASRLPSEEQDRADTELSAMQEAMFAALDERSETLAGTALIGLELLSRTHEEFDRELVVEKTVEVASDEAASPSCRLTALRLASMTEGSESATGVARSLAQTGETILLRSAAIVTLGEIGTADDRELIESFTFSENRQIVAAAKMALRKLEDALRQQKENG